MQGRERALLTARSHELASVLIALAPDALERFLGADGSHAHRVVVHPDGREERVTAVPAYSHAARYPLMVRLGIAARVRALPAGRERERLLALDARYAACVSPPLGLEEEALSAWLSAERGREQFRLAKLLPTPFPALDTQALAWTLVAHAVTQDAGRAALAAEALAARQEPSGLFHDDASRTGFAHFNAQAYAIHALATHGSGEGVERAARAADALVRLQGPLGQWWWLYDPARGRVADRYPAYAVHQAGMMPMALAALARAGGPVHAEALEDSLEWLFGRNELGRSLVEPDRALVYRAVRRHSAWSRRIAPALARRGLGALNALLPGKELNRETRSYEMGWTLRALGPLVGPVPRAHEGCAVAV